jgi:hypothetical protein
MLSTWATAELRSKNSCRSRFGDAVDMFGSSRTIAANRVSHAVAAVH